MHRVLQQHGDARARRRYQVITDQLGDSRAVAACDWIAGAGVVEQIRHRGRRGQGQQKPATRAQGGEAIRCLQQKRHAHPQFRPFRAWKQGDPLARGQGGFPPGRF